jgi:hypothetical protein
MSRVSTGAISGYARICADRVAVQEDAVGGPVSRYDLEDLAEAETGAAQLKADFEGASKFQERNEGAVGYPGLAGALNEFVDNWSHKREKMLESLESTRQTLTEIRTNLREHDTAAAGELRSAE